MNVHSQYFGSTAAMQYFGCSDIRFAKTEDSGYDTTSTPDSIYDSESSKENIDQPGSTNQTHSTPRKRRIAECSSGFSSRSYYNPDSEPYPITPIKRNCRLNPCKTSSKKLDFTGHQIHSLECQISELQPVKQVTKAQTVQSVFVPCQQTKRIDWIQNLYEHNIIPPIETILGYLQPEDILNFTRVSPEWLAIWKCAATKKMKHKYKVYLESLRQNQENLFRRVIPTEHKTYIAARQTPPRSPPGTPKTYRFRKFMKSASSDLRTQMLCVRCSDPAKVTIEESGEQWLLCTNKLCSYEFCICCKCPRHPDKKCFQYDLNGPSPSKRKKTLSVVGTKNSRKNLRRLL